MEGGGGGIGGREGHRIGGERVGGSQIDISPKICIQ